MSNKENKKHAFIPGNAIIITIALAALKADGIIDIPWIGVIAPIIINVILGIVIALVAMLWLGIMGIRNSIKANNRFYNTYNSRPLYWDYKTKTMYDATTGRKIDNSYVTEEEQE